MDVVYFDTPADLRAWLEQHHADVAELWIGFYRKDSGKAALTFAQALDEALCFGWIDGIRRRVDDVSYANRFTPRKRASNWSAVNVKRVGELAEQGRMHPAGLKAFEERDRARQQHHPFEDETRTLAEEYERRFQEHPAAWAFFQAQPPSYRKNAGWWVMNAKKEETRLKRLATLIDDSANGLRIAMLRR